MSLVGLGLVPTRMGEGGLSTEIPFLLAPSAPPPDRPAGMELIPRGRSPRLGRGQGEEAVPGLEPGWQCPVLPLVPLFLPTFPPPPPLPPLTWRKIHSPFWQPSPSPHLPLVPVPACALHLPSARRAFWVRARSSSAPSAAPALASLLLHSWPVRRPIHRVLGSGQTPRLFPSHPRCCSGPGQSPIALRLQGSVRRRRP